MGSQERRQAHPQTMVDRVASQQTADFVGGPQNNAFLLSIQGNLNNRLITVQSGKTTEIILPIRLHGFRKLLICLWVNCKNEILGT